MKAIIEYLVGSWEWTIRTRWITCIFWMESIAVFRTVQPVVNNRSLQQVSSKIVYFVHLHISHAKLINNRFWCLNFSDRYVIGCLIDCLLPCFISADKIADMIIFSKTSSLLQSNVIHDFSLNIVNNCQLSSCYSRIFNFVWSILITLLAP